MTARFTVISVTGHPIEPRYMHGGTSWKKPTTLWFVIDTAYNHRTIASFVPRGGLTSRLCHERANQLCSKLNDWEKGLNVR